jgi:hypothetical protein
MAYLNQPIKIKINKTGGCNYWIRTGDNQFNGTAFSLTQPYEIDVTKFVLDNMKWQLTPEMFNYPTDYDVYLNHDTYKSFTY